MDEVTHAERTALAALAEIRAIAKQAGAEIAREPTERRRSRSRAQSAGLLDHAAAFQISGVDLALELGVTRQRVGQMDAVDAGLRPHARLKAAIAAVAERKYGIPPELADHPEAPYAAAFASLAGGRFTVKGNARARCTD